MAIRSTRSIYTILEDHLRTAEQPLTVTDLMEFSDVREEAIAEFGTESASNKISDTLGFMWRRGLLTRYPAPRTERSFARYAYVWDMKDDAKPVEPIQNSVFTTKRDFTITEVDSGIRLDFEKFSILIKPK